MAACLYLGGWSALEVWTLEVVRISRTSVEMGKMKGDFFWFIRGRKTRGRAT